MYDNYKILGLIPARGGSKGIKDKNIEDLCGKPLIFYSIHAGKESAFIDDVVVTTDSKRIASVAREAGASVPFIRPVELAQDKTRTIDVVVHAVHKLQELGRSYDILVLLQPTSPLRTETDIDRAIQTFFQHGLMGLSSVSLVEEHPLLMRTIEKDHLLPILKENSTCRRQDMDPYYRVNGSIYINRIDQLNGQTSLNDNSIPFITEKWKSIDIDEMEDLLLAEYYLKRMMGVLDE